jgi:hypothetical protein
LDVRTFSLEFIYKLISLMQFSLHDLYFIHTLEISDHLFSTTTTTILTPTTITIKSWLIRLYPSLRRLPLPLQRVPKNHGEHRKRLLLPSHRKLQRHQELPSQREKRKSQLILQLLLWSLRPSGNCPRKAGHLSRPSRNPLPRLIKLMLSDWLHSSGNISRVPWRREFFFNPRAKEPVDPSSSPSNQRQPRNPPERRNHE